MRIDIIRYEPYTLSLRPFKFFFQQLNHWFLQLQSCFIKWYETERSKKLCIHNGGCFETLNLLHVSSWKMCTCILRCVTWNKTKNANKFSRVCSMDWKSSLTTLQKVFSYKEVQFKWFCKWKTVTHLLKNVNESLPATVTRPEVSTFPIDNLLDKAC